MSAACLKENVQRVAIIVATSLQDGGLHWKGEENKEKGKAGDKRLRDSRSEKKGKRGKGDSHGVARRVLSSSVMISEIAAPTILRIKFCSLAACVL
jgi:hypothetical protein